MDFRLEPAGLEHFDEPLHALGLLAGRFPEAEAVAIDMFDDARRHDLGRRINRAADRSLRPDRTPLATLRIDALELQIGILAFETVKVPPRNAVLRRHHR